MNGAIIIICFMLDAIACHDGIRPCVQVRSYENCSTYFFNQYNEPSFSCPAVSRIAMTPITHPAANPFRSWQTRRCIHPWYLMRCVANSDGRPYRRHLWHGNRSLGTVIGSAHRRPPPRNFCFSRWRAPERIHVRQLLLVRWLGFILGCDLSMAG